MEFDPKQWQFWAWAVGRVVVVLVGLYALLNWVVAQQFEHQLQLFHQVAKPEISKMVDEKIKHNHDQADKTHINDEHRKLDGQLAALESEVEHIHNLVWTLYRSQLGDRPPDQSPYRNGGAHGAPNATK